MPRQSFHMILDPERYKNKFHLFLVLGIALLAACKGSQGEIKPDDSYAIAPPPYFGKYTIPVDNPLSKSGVLLGRHLFYEKKLSLDNSISCGSCHVQKHAFSDPATLSIGVNGTLGKRQSMSLSNLMWQTSFFWDGRSASLEDQALKPIVDAHEMQETLERVVDKLKKDPLYPPMFKNAFGSEEITSDRIAKALSQFERTLISGNSKYDQYLNNKYIPTASEKNGMDLFFNHPDPSLGIRGGNCGDCHSGKLLINNNFHNNGLSTDADMKDLGLGEITSKVGDRGRFKTPSLRNIALTAPYMHDGRFRTLEEVLEQYNAHIQESSTLDPLIISASNELNGRSLKLTEAEKKDIINFLHMLSDDTFINNPEFSDPFKK